MALIKCPECGREVSSRAISCPNCGYPIYEETQIAQNPVDVEAFYKKRYFTLFDENDLWSESKIKLAIDNDWEYVSSPEYLNNIPLHQKRAEELEDRWYALLQMKGDRNEIRAISQEMDRERHFVEDSVCPALQCTLCGRYDKKEEFSKAAIKGILRIQAYKILPNIISSVPIKYLAEYMGIDNNELYDWFYSEEKAYYEACEEVGCYSYQIEWHLIGNKENAYFVASNKYPLANQQTKESLGKSLPSSVDAMLKKQKEELFGAPTEKEASVIKRGIVGGLIAGEAGAIIGSLSAIDKNNKLREEKK